MNQPRRRVIIPAAGRAVRFGGIPKELLPIGVHDTPLQRAVSLGEKIGDPVVITNPEKAPLHQQLLPDVEFVQQGARHELWGAICVGLEPGRGGALIMADTVTDFCHRDFDMPLMFGTFTTQEAYRFSLIHDDRILTKEDLPGTHQAWGVIVWSAAVTDFLLTLDVSHYDRAFEAAMAVFPHGIFPLSYYHDLGTFEAYCHFLATLATPASPVRMVLQ